jgi:DDE_Tnp_1-associated
METNEAGRRLVKAFGKVPDPRKPRGRRHPLAAILALSTAAMLAGARSLFAIAEWGRAQDAAVVAALGFDRQQTPCVAAFEAALAGWARAELRHRPGAIAIDGKALRGIHGEELPGVRLVAAYSDEAGLVLAQTGGQQPGP